ncbi:hypothetical protein BC832DRAFT_92925 [Gaertneriomyces semiglobifer]|nr:hypothetical protein BC832DRAFT_92925 [Gaertneriomyces semiglobifer]
MRHRHGDKITLGKLKEIVKEKEEKGAASTSTRDPHHHHVAGTSTLGGASSSPALTTSTSREKPGGDGDTLQNDDALPLPLPLPLLTQTPLAQSPPYTIPTFSIHEFRTSARYNFSKGGMLEQVEGVTVLDGGILFADEVADSRSQEAVYRIIDASRVIDGSGAASAEHCQLDERTDAPHSRADFAHVSSASEFDLRYLHPPLLYLMSFYFPSLPPLIFLLRSFLLDPLPSFPSMLLNGLLCIFRLPTILVSLYFAHLAYGGTTLYAKYAWCVMPLLPVLWYHSPPEPAWYGRLASARVLWLWMARMGTKIAAAKEAHKMRLLDPEGELRVAQVRAHEAEVALAASNSRSGNATTTSLTTPPASSALMGRKYYYTNHHVRTNRFRICITSLAPGTITLSYTLPQSLVVSLCTQSQNAAASRRNSTSGTTSIAPSDVRVLIDDTLHHDVSVSMPKGVIVLTKVTGGSRKIKVGIKGYWSCETVVDVTGEAPLMFSCRCR